MGEILDFPRDNLRYQYFARESNQHQAKLEIRTFEWLVEEYTKIGEEILDPMSGIGTVHWAATMGRSTIAIEISPEFAEIQRTNIKKLDETRGINGPHLILEGDCRRFLPMTPGGIRRSIIFSPPYGDLWKKSAGPKSKFMEEKHINIGYDLQDANVGNITNYPVYLIAMKEIYRLCNQSLRIGELLIIVTKDYVKGGERVHITKDNIMVCHQVGFLTVDWHQRYTDPKLFQIKARENRVAKGLIYKPELDIDFEDLVVLEKVSDA
jgi:modification methylase